MNQTNPDLQCDTKVLYVDMGLFSALISQSDRRELTRDNTDTTLILFVFFFGLPSISRDHG